MLAPQFRHFAAALSLPLFAAACATGAESDGRVSSTVAFSTDRTLASWLAAPGGAAVESWVRFPADLDEAVWFGINMEFVGGTRNPTRFAQEDFAALVLMTRDGLVALPKGTPESQRGTPDNNDIWEPRTLERVLAPDVWHRVRLEADFDALRFSRLIVQSPGAVVSELDISDVPLSYPNPIPVDGRALTWYVHAIANTPAKDGASTEVVFDDVRGEVWLADRWTDVYREGFEKPFCSLPDVPFTFPEMEIRNAQEGRLYRENERALLRHAPAEGRSGGALVADARLD